MQLCLVGIKEGDTQKDVDYMWVAGVGMIGK